MKIQINNILPIVDFGKNTDKTIFLSSSARSGSTFFANLLNYENDYRILFEPLSKEHVQRTSKLNFPSYLDKNNSKKKFIDFFNHILTGQISNHWIDRENQAGFYTKRLIKEVRSNMLLPWIRENFPEIKCILLIRNPLSVITSWDAMKFEDGFQLREIILSQKSLLSVIPEYIIDSYKKENDAFLLSLYYWCISNSIPFKQCDNNSYLIVKYEDLVLRRESTINDIKNFTGIDIKAISEVKFNKSSSSSDYEKSDPIIRINKLKDSLKKETLAEAQKIMELFEIGHIYNLKTEN